MQKPLPKPLLPPQRHTSAQWQAYIDAMDDWHYLTTRPQAPCPDGAPSTSVCPRCQRAEEKAAIRLEEYARAMEDPPHDLAGLEVFMALVLPLEEQLTALDAYKARYWNQLRPCEQQGLAATIRSLAMTVADLHNRP